MPGKDKAGLLKEFESLLGRETQSPRFGSAFGVGSGRSLLMNRLRMDIFVNLHACPWSCLARIAHAVNTDAPAILWHLNKMERIGLVERRTAGRLSVYAPHAYVSPDDFATLCLMSNAGQAITRTLSVITGQPGLSRAELAQKTGLHVQTLARALSRLRKHDIIGIVRDGRQTRHYLSIRLKERHRFYRIRERQLRSVLIARLRDDGLSPVVQRTGGGSVTLVVNAGGERETVEFCLNPFSAAFRALAQHRQQTKRP